MLTSTAPRNADLDPAIYVKVAIFPISLESLSLNVSVGGYILRRSRARMNSFYLPK